MLLSADVIVVWCSGCRATSERASAHWLQTSGVQRGRRRRDSGRDGEYVPTLEMGMVGKSVEADSLRDLISRKKIEAADWRKKRTAGTAWRDETLSS